uniref:Uncharacterized protein n=1 Tax=Knipowitschia caucasica TaxID=637954 RepID=A0AAV2K059_KNICA
MSDYRGGSGRRLHLSGGVPASDRATQRPSHSHRHGCVQEQASGSDPADHGGATEESSDVPGTSSSNESEGGSGHGAPITTLPIVTWKWHHVEAPYIVMLWILVCWLCKLGESRPH